MPKDELVEEVRKAREAQAGRWGFDLNAVLADARKRQSESNRKVVSFVAKTPKTG